MRDPGSRAPATLLSRLHPSTLRRALGRRLALRRARKLARAGCDARTIARRTGLAEDLVRIVVARG
jgi:hypothetical protein